MQAGRLRHRGVIEHLGAKSDTVSDSGESQAEWTEFKTVWMSIEPLRGRELFAAQEYHNETTVRIRMRFLEGVTPKMRVLYEDKYYPILAIVDPGLRHRELELMCTEGVHRS